VKPNPSEMEGLHLNAKKWEPNQVELVPKKLAKIKQENLLAELAQILYFNLCQLQKKKQTSIDLESRSITEMPLERTGSDD
jgi:hypothetical protein